MSESEFLCLAVSRSQQGYYAAGIDLANGEWVRVVARHGAELSLGALRVDAPGMPRRMRPLDVVRLSLGAPVPKRFQPENRLLVREAADAPFSLLRNAAEDENLIQMIRGLAQVSKAEDLLFGSETRELTSDVDGLSSSLFVVESEHLYWRKTKEYKKNRDQRYLGSGPCMEGEFDFGAFPSRYCLPVADVAWEHLVSANVPEDRFIQNEKLLELLNSPLQDDIFLTVSFDDDVIADGHQYKFISGVLILPKL